MQAVKDWEQYSSRRQMKVGDESHSRRDFYQPMKKKFIIELELLAVLWTIENIRNYLSGTEFEVVS